jgi:hypothetical protein
VLSSSCLVLFGCIITARPTTIVEHPNPQDSTFA